MSNRTHHDSNGYQLPRPLLPSPSPSSITPAFPMFRNETPITPLHEILERYKDDSDTLRVILASKTAEDNRRAEEERTRAERYRLESKRMELEISRRSYATPSPVEGRPYHLPVPILSVPTPPQRVRMELPPIKRRKSESRTPVSTLEMPLPRLDHDQVMEKLRNKIHTRQLGKKGNSESPTMPVSAQVSGSASPSMSPPKDKQRRADFKEVKIEAISGSESDGPTTTIAKSNNLSNVRPKRSPMVNEDKLQRPPERQDKSSSPQRRYSNTDDSKQKQR